MGHRSEGGNRASGHGAETGGHFPAQFPEPTWSSAGAVSEVVLGRSHAHRGVRGGSHRPSVEFKMTTRPAKPETSTVGSFADELADPRPLI